jgi:hypothetical protein
LAIAIDSSGLAVIGFQYGYQTIRAHGISSFPIGRRSLLCLQCSRGMRTGKSEYTEAEAAAELDVSIDRFRAMIRAHILDGDEDLENLSIAAFQPSDLLILRLLGGRP